jgi:hypothetical protein
MGGSLTVPRILVLATAVLAVSVALAPQAWAPVPPRNCGMLEAKGNVFNIKSDQLRCRKARRYARRYLVSHRRPRGYSCRDYGRQTRIKFRCSKGARVIFAIRR